MPSICELKIALKAKGIKGITGLNKAGLERLLSGGKTETKKEAKKEEPKPKPFTPAPTKSESPKVAEKPINKKIKAPKMLMITYKEPKNEPKKESKAVKPQKTPLLNDFQTIMLTKDKGDINELLKSMGFQGYGIKGNTETARKAAFNMLKKNYLSTDKYIKHISIEEFISRFNKENCVDLMCKYGINSKAEYKEWVLKNHPDKGGTINVDDFNQIVACANKNSFCKK
jgi:hypothetical protein